MDVPVEALFEQEDDFQLCNGVYLRVLDKDEESGRSALNEVEETLLLTWMSSGAIGNGGLYCYLSYTNEFETTATAFDRIGLLDAACVLREVMTRYPGGILPSDDDQRCLFWARYEDEHRADVDGMQRRFWTATDDLESNMSVYLRSNRAALFDL